MKIIKIDKNGKETNYGGGYKNPYEVIPKSYKDCDGLFFGNPKTKCIYVIEREERDNERV